VKRIESKLNTASADFQANAEHNRRLAEAFKEKQDKVRASLNGLRETLFTFEPQASTIVYQENV